VTSAASAAVGMDMEGTSDTSESEKAKLPGATEALSNPRRM
jgi:hypothetical protein